MKLSELDLTDTELIHLTTLMESNLHHVIMDAILSELSGEDQKIFLDNVLQENHTKVWDHLNSKVENIEEKIIIVAEQLKEELHKDIKETKK